MKKRSILSLVLAVVMLFSVLGVFPMTVSAAGSTYASDDAAIGAGYYFRTGAEGSATYYNSIYTACDEVGEGGTVTVLHDFELATGGQGVGKTWTDPKTYTIDGNGKTLTYKANRVFDIACSNLTIKDLIIQQNVNSAISFGQVRKSSVVVYENVTATATQTSWGFTPIYGSLTLKGSTSITCTGTNASNNVAVRIDNDGNSDVTTTRVVTKELVLEDGASISAASGKVPISYAANTGGVVYINSRTARVSGANCNLGAMVLRAPISIDSDDAATKTALNAMTTCLGASGYVATTSDGFLYGTLALAVANVPENGTVTLQKSYNMSANEVLVAANSGESIKTFDINGNDKTITFTGNTNGLDFANCDVTITNLTIIGNKSNTLLRTGNGTTVTLDGCTLTAAKTYWGAICVYGNLVLKDTSISLNTANYAGAYQDTLIRLEKKAMDNQAFNNGNNIAETINPSLTLQSGVELTNNAGPYVIFNACAAANAPSITVESADLTVTVPEETTPNITYGTATLADPDDLPAGETAEQWTAVYTLFGMTFPTVFVAKRVDAGGNDLKNYYTVNGAIKQVQGNGDKVVLLTNSDQPIIVENNKTFTIDGDGKTVTIAINNPALTVASGSTVTLINTTLGYAASAKPQTAISLGGSLTLGTGTTVNSTYSGFAGGNGAANGVRTTANGAVLVIDGATINAQGTALVSDAISSTMTLRSGTINASYRFYIANNATVTLNIEGGTINANGTQTPDVFINTYTGGIATINISGGTIDFSALTNATMVNGSKATVNITGGSIKNKNGTLSREATMADLAAALVSDDPTLRVPRGATATNSGIAFSTKFDEASLVSKYGSAYSRVAMGTIILPKDYAEDITGAVNYASVTDLGTDFYLDIANGGYYNNETAAEDGYKLWYGSIVNINAWNTARDFCGFGYVTATLGVNGIGSVTVTANTAVQTANAKDLATGVVGTNAAQTAMLEFFTADYAD